MMSCLGALKHRIFRARKSFNKLQECAAGQRIVSDFFYFRWPKVYCTFTWKTSIKQMPFEVHTLHTTHKLTRSVSLNVRTLHTQIRETKIYTKLTDKSRAYFIPEITFITNGPFEATEIISTINLLLLYLTKKLRLRNFSPNYKSLIYQSFDKWSTFFS